MNKIATCCLLVWSAFCSAELFHTPSVTEFGTEKDSKFGYSLSYRDKSYSLIVGAPHADMDGRVYSCPLRNDIKNNDCEAILDSQSVAGKWGQFKSRSKSPNQYFWLGASVAATPDYIISCAPLLTGNVEIQLPNDRRMTRFKAFGTCFIKNETNVEPVNIDLLDAFNGAIGWSFLVDKDIDAIIFSNLRGGQLMSTSAIKPYRRTTLAVSDPSPIFNEEWDSMGRALTSGVFFVGQGTVYAFSVQYKGYGSIAFLYYNKATKGLKILSKKKKSVTFGNAEHGSLFGATLNAADFNQDRYSELLVGAPTSTHKGIFETGAVYIYLGGKEVKTYKESDICIVNSKGGSRFGTAIATADIDEDNLPELFVSAPYGDGGYVYIISGFKMRQILKQSKSTCILVTDIRDQELHSPMSSFGFILQPALNYNENGANALAIGAPFEAKVFSYRSIPCVNVTMLVSLVGRETVRQLDRNFTVTVEVRVTYPSKPADLFVELFVKTNISQDIGATINETDESYTIKIFSSHKRSETFRRNITIYLSDEEPRIYKFTASVETDTKLLEKKEYSESLLRLSEYSVDRYELSVMRRCKGDECVPRLKMEVYGMAGPSQPINQLPDYYVLGSSSDEIITVSIKNEGNTSYESCAKIKVAGAVVVQWNCLSDKTQVFDVCKFIELESGSKEQLNIYLDMSQISSKVKQLELEVFLYDKCSISNASAVYKKNVIYNLTTSDVSVNGISFERNVTDVEIADKLNSTSVDFPVTFIIKNDGAVKWEHIVAEIIVEQPYINDIEILTTPSSCIRIPNKELFIRNCNITVDAKYSVKIFATIYISKDEIAKNLYQNKLEITSELKVHLKPTSEVKSFKLLSTVISVKDETLANSKSYILIISIAAAFVILLIIGLILYATGFFKRSEKKKLEDLKEEVRRKSMRRSDMPALETTESTFDLLDNEIEMEVIESHSKDN